MIDDTYKSRRESTITLNIRAAVDYLKANRITWSQVNIAAALNAVCGYKGGQSGVSKWASRHMGEYIKEYNHFHGRTEEE